MKIIENVNKVFTNILEKLKFFVSKDNYTKTKILLVVILSGILSILCEYTIFRVWYPEFISKNRIMLVALIFMFIGIHFVFKLSKMYEFIHKHRYKIACAFMLFVMIFKYSGSSIVNFDGLIQSHNDDTRYHTLLGRARMIRTDEWATSTTYILSQSKSSTPFQYYSGVLRGTKTDMFSVANSAVTDILMLGRVFQIGFMLFGNDVGLSFYWYIRLVAMMLGAYELCLILTKKNKKVSLCGMIVITFSAAVQWWYCMDTLIWGQIAIVLIDKFMNTDKKRNKYLCALGILISGLSYIFVFYPAWLISFGYVFLALAIWVVIKNVKYGNYKFNKHDIIVILITILCMGLLLGRWYMLSKDTLVAEMSTDYPGERNEVGGGALNLYSYFYNIFFTFEDYLNPCEFSSMLSLFPIPILLGLIYVIRNKKDLHFWIPMLTVTMFLSIWCIWGFPSILAQITKMSMSTAGRASIPLGTACIYLLIYLIGNWQDGDKLVTKNRKVTFCIALILDLYIIYKAKTTIGYAEEFKYLDRFKILLGGEIFLALIYGVLNIDNEKIKNYTIYGLIIVALVTGLRVNPIIRTTDIFYTKPVAIKMQEIKKEDPSALWVVNDGGWYINDYALANGIKVLNSTQLYPNMELFKTLLGDKAEESRSIYNRYAHMNLEITDKDTEVSLLYADNIALKLNYKDLSKIDVKYVLSTESFSKKNFSNYFEEIYNEDGIYIYKVMEGTK